jgi:hypothetical protein
VRDGRNVQRDVGGAAGGGDGGGGVLQAPPRDQVARQRAALGQHLHHAAAGAARQRMALAVDRRHGRRPEEGQAQRLGHHAHGVGGELARARAHGHGAAALDGVQLLQRDGAGLVAAHALDGAQHGLLLAVGRLPWQHGAAVDEDRGHVQPHHGHQRAGQRLVAAAEADQGVVGVAAHGDFHAVGDELARDQAHAHAVVVHRRAVGHRDGVHHHRHAAAFGHAQARAVDLGPERLGTGRVVAGGADEGDHGLAQVLVVETGGAQEGAVRGAGHAFGDHAGASFVQHGVSCFWC